MAGVKKIGQYRLTETLGAGSFGNVIRAEHQMTGHLVAVKILSKERVRHLDMVNKIKREIQILKLFHHPHIIKLYQVITSPTDIFMMMEYVSGGELFDYILEHGKLEEADARKFFQQIISGVDYCHRHMVVHRDLKPENLLLDAENNVKIADFGLSNIMTDGDFLKTSCGSPNYASPEVISGMLYAGPEVDVWSCGVILYVLLCGKLPFDEDYVPHLFKKIKDGVYEMPAALSADAKDVLSGMLRVDSLARLTIPQIREHPWFVIDLADYLFPGPDNDEPEATQFDEAAIAEVCQKFQVYREHVLDVLRESKSDTKNQINIAYRLILTNRKLAASGHTLGPEEVEVSDGSFLNRPRRESSKARGLLPERGLLGPKAAPTIHVQPAAAGPATPGTGAVDAEVSTGPAGKSLPRSKWHLGMRSQNEPHEVMVEVYRAMLALNFQWKVITPYHARCRCWNQVSGTMMKMNLQLYRVSEHNYLLDLRALPTRQSEGLKVLEPGSDPTRTHDHAHDHDDSEWSDPHTLEFFELCAMLIQELGR